MDTGKKELSNNEVKAGKFSEDVEKPAWIHVETLSNKKKKNTTTTSNVVGSRRHLTDTSSTHDERKNTFLPSFWKRRALHIRRYWMLYVAGLIIFLAIFLPVLYVFLPHHRKTSAHQGQLS
jgi:predicted double-glycine peptidase